MQVTPEFDDFKEYLCPRLSAAARKIEENLDRVAAVSDKDTIETNTMLMHIERYVATPFGYFPSLM